MTVFFVRQAVIQIDQFSATNLFFIRIINELNAIIFSAATNDTTSQMENKQLELYDTYNQTVREPFYEEGVLYSAIESGDSVKFSMMAVDKTICEENNFNTQAILKLLSDS